MPKLILSLTILISTYRIVPAQSSIPEEVNPLSNSIGITAEIGGTIPKTDYKVDELGITYRLLLEYFFNSKSAGSFALRLSGGGGILQGEVFSNDFVYPPAPNSFITEIYFGGVGLLYSYKIGNTIPYLSANVSYSYFNPLDGNGYQLPNNQFSVYENSSMIYSAEGGIRFPFHPNWSLNLGININFTSSDYFDDIQAGYNNDAFISFFTGVSYYINFNKDSDNDGIDDDVDLCPDTPGGMKVNEFGCSTADLKSEIVFYDTLKDHFLLDGIFSDEKLFCFQVDVFQDLEKAEHLQHEIILFGYKADVFKVKFGGLIWYSVRIGYFNSFDNAKLFKDNFFKTTNLKLN